MSHRQEHLEPELEPRPSRTLRHDRSRPRPRRHRSPPLPDRFRFRCHRSLDPSQQFGIAGGRHVAATCTRTNRKVRSKRVRDRGGAGVRARRLADFLGRRSGGESAGSGGEVKRPCRSVRHDLELDTEAVAGLGGWLLRMTWRRRECRLRRELSRCRACRRHWAGSTKPPATVGSDALPIILAATPAADAQAKPHRVREVPCREASGRWVRGLPRR